jgi:tetratricopeptide (TPR) repeat protein
MNDNEEILAELRKISAWTDMQRKITKRSLITIAVVIPAMIIFAIVADIQLNKSQEDVLPPGKPAKPNWGDVDWNVRYGDIDEAIRIGEELIQKTPQYPEGHNRLAAAYLAAGKIEQAREHYAHAFRLFPSEENERLLLAIDRRIKGDIPQPNGAANGSQPLRPETNSTSSAAASRH